MEHHQGKCSALITREGFFDFRVCQTLCNVSHHVALVCQHSKKMNLVLSNNMSDIKISFVDGFHRIQVFSSCDPGWFMVDDMCINFYLCQNCANKIASHKQCERHGGQLAYRLLNNVTISTPGNILDNSTKLSVFWDMFYHVEDMSPTLRDYFKVCESIGEATKGQKYFAVNGSDLCVAFNISNQCMDSDIVLAVTYCDLNVHVPWEWEQFYDTFNFDISSSNSLPLGSVINQLIFKTEQYKHFSLCEKPVVHTAMLTNCSDLYMSCDEGTCIHDSLVCDGHSHCPHGEDEVECQHICSNYSHNCMTHCHHRDLCSCSSGYFQCVSGGCVPLQKLCDRIPHCTDASDEPPTCVYLRREQLIYNQSLYLDVNKYINALIQQNKVTVHRCLQSSNGSLVDVQNVEYKMRYHKQRCSLLSLSSDIKFLCGMYRIPVKDPFERYFDLPHICVYDPACGYHDQNCCFDGSHLLKCEHMYCVRRFKCPSTYCTSFDHICNNVCDCPQCEDESFCSKLLCPGMVLIEQLGSGLRCSQKVATLKYSMTLRQVIHRKGVNITDDFPVFIYLEDVMNIRHFILTPELVVHCEIRHSNVTINDLSMLHRMVSMRRLLLPHNNIQKVYDSMFAFMSQLILLDLSHNLITFLPKFTLCALRNLLYISLHHNLIAEIPARLFVNNFDLQVLLLECNDLKPQSVIIDAPFSSLYRLSSDIPRLCCAFETIHPCEPPFPLFVSCSNLISSKALIVFGWLTGLSTPILSLVCLCLLIYKLCIPETQTPRVAMLYSLNLNLAELVTSLCILSYSVINVVFDDEFGIIADHWRHSLACLSLESIFLVSSRASLAFAVCLSVHFAIHSPSVIPRKTSQKVTLFKIITLWLVITPICITVQVLEKMRNIDPFNYFCFPFTTLFPSDPLILSLHIVLLIFDVILIIVTIASHGYLLAFAIRRSKNKTLQSVGKRKERLQKGARLSVLILSTFLTWLPILCVQILVLLKITILPNIYFWCILVSFPINLIIDPTLLMRSMLA